jgi:hypothetical protein
MSNTNPTQAALILAHLQQRPITPLEALDLYGCFRLGARIWELKQDGYDIVTDTVEKNGKRFARYRLADWFQNEKRPVGENHPGVLGAQPS